MERMYQGCHLIHADLSEYNMLWFEGRIYFIDLSQSVEPSHPNGLEFLVRDCRNVSSFFTKCGVRDVMSCYELFNHLTGLDISADNHEEFLVKVRRVCVCVCVRVCVCVMCVRVCVMCVRVCVCIVLMCTEIIQYNAFMYTVVYFSTDQANAVCTCTRTHTHCRQNGI